MKTYQQFYVSFGVRKIEQLLTPPLPSVARLELPKRSIVHYLGASRTDDGPRVDYTLFAKNTKPIRIKHVFELADKQGNPRRVMMQVSELARNFRTNNTRFRNFIDLTQALRDDMSLTTVNYAFLPRLYTYQRVRMTGWNQAHNLFVTLINEIKSMQAQGFNQFLEIEIPEVIPKPSVLTTAEKVLTAESYRTFSDPKLFFLLQIWKWLGPNHSTSLIHTLVPEGFKDLNLVIREGDRFCVLSLNTLMNWRRATTKELMIDQSANRKGADPQATQKRYLRLLMSVAALRQNDLPENLGDDGEAVVDGPLPLSDDNGITVDGSIDQFDMAVDGEEVFQESIDKDLDVLEEFGADVSTLNGQSDIILETDDETNPDTPVILDQEELEASALQPYPSEPDKAFLKKCADLADRGDISAADYRRAVEAVESGKMAMIGDQSIKDYVIIPPEDLVIGNTQIMPDLPVVVDKTMLHSSLNTFDSQYIEKVFQKDVAAMVYNVMGAGIQITSYNMVEVNNAGGSHFEYTIQLKPLVGKPSTIRFKLPKPDENGNYSINGVFYSTRKQKGDIPIHKITSNRVALTSYYGKVFVDRSEKRTNDWGKWIVNRVYALGADPQNQVVTDMVAGNSFLHENFYPKLYSTLAQGFRTFTLTIEGKRFKCVMCPKDPNSTFGVDQVQLWNTEGRTIVGQTDSGELLLIDENSNFQMVDLASNVQEMARIEEVLGLDPVRAPVEFATASVMGQDISVGVILSYLMGFNNLCRTLGVNYRRVPTGKRVGLTKTEWAIVFEDQTVVFDRNDRLATIILSGFRDYHKTVGMFPLSEFDHRDVYLSLLEEKKIGVRYLRELTLQESVFIDSITRELLKEMGEPLVWNELLIRACELLLSDQHPHEQDARYMRVKGIERMAGMVYGELVNSLRVHSGMPGRNRYGIEMNPYAVWMAVQDDGAKDQVSDINPIQDMKQKEALTASGTGGRGSRSMVARTRIYHETDKGTVSESTVDSSDVAVNTFMSANPKLTNLRGITARYKNEDGYTSLLSSSALVSPGSTRDDPKRVNFIGIQNRHVVGCDAYQQPIVRTGYEYVIPYRVSKLFACMAKMDGEVISINHAGIIVEYSDGKRIGTKLGRIYGSAAGLVIPHFVKTNLSVGEKFAKGDAIAYNTGFFEQDILDPRRIIWKSAMLVNTVFIESPDTLEDSSSISKALTKRLVTKSTKPKDIIITFDQEIHKLVKIGDEVGVDTSLCLIEDALSAENYMLDEETVDTLRELDQLSPRAKMVAVVERIEIFYNGELDDMSDSLRTYVEQSDGRKKRSSKAIGEESSGGLVNETFRINNDPLLTDTACIRIYLTTQVAAGIGDKGVFGNQLKTVFGNVFEETTTESGEVIDAIFGQKSESDRIVSSPAIIGSTNTLNVVVGKRIVNAYRGIPLTTNAS